MIKSYISDKHKGQRRSTPAMPESRDDARLINLVGAAALGLADASLADVAVDNGLDISAAAALVTLLDLARSGSVQALSQLIGISHSGAVRLVNRLAVAGLVERTDGPDGRTIAVRLTRPGLSVARRIRSARRAAIAASLSGLTDRQREQLSTICEVLVANVTSARLATRAAGRTPSGGALCRMCDPLACGRPDGDCPAVRAAARTD
jgi:MarR family transcriptional regulator, negative regulator of the multidrug operon emrRAB